MAGETERQYFTYVSDDGSSYSVKLGKDIGSIAELGFTAFDAANKSLPQGYRMRYCNVQAASGGRTRRYPVGAVTSDVWTAADKVLAVMDKGAAVATNWNVVYLAGEHRRIPHSIA